MGLYLPFLKDENELSFFMLSLLYLKKINLSIENLENMKHKQDNEKILFK